MNECIQQEALPCYGNQLNHPNTAYPQHAQLPE